VRAVWGMAFLLVVSVACSETLSPPPVADAGWDAVSHRRRRAGRRSRTLGRCRPERARCRPASRAGRGLVRRVGVVRPPLGHEAQVYPAMALDLSGALLVAYVELVESPGVVATELHVVRLVGLGVDTVGGTVASSTDRFPYSAPLFVRLAIDGTGPSSARVRRLGAGRHHRRHSRSRPGGSRAASGSRSQVPVAAPQLSGIASTRPTTGRCGWCSHRSRAPGAGPRRLGLVRGGRNAGP
jgi:hypothetical protein